MKNTKYLATVDVGGKKAVKSYSKNKVTVKSSYIVTEISVKLL